MNGDDDLSTITPQDRDLAIRTMIGEEGSPDGMAGVASTILNRAKTGAYGGKNLTSVVLAPGQFEPWSARPQDLLAIQPNDPRYQQAAQIFDGVASGKIPDLTNGATHFYAPVAQKALGRQPPTWGAGQPNASLGKTLFFAPNGPVKSSAPAVNAISTATQGKSFSPDYTIGAANEGSIPSANELASTNFNPDPMDTSQGTASPMELDASVPSSVAMGKGIVTPSAQPAADLTNDPRVASLVKPMADLTQDPRLQGLLKPLPSAQAPVAAAGKPALDLSADPRLAGLLKPLPPPPGQNAGKYDIGSINGHTFSVGSSGPASTPASDVVDPYTPVTQQLATAARNAGSYALGQAEATPGAIAENYHNSVGLAGQGVDELGSWKSARPSFPSADPRTWEAGGALKTAAGAIGAVMSPLTGLIQTGVKEPVNQATGGPQTVQETNLAGTPTGNTNVLDPGERADFVANTAAGPMLSRVAGGIPGAIANKLVGTLSPEDAALADLARNKFGIPVNAGQMSGSTATKFLSSTLNRLPLSGAGKDAANIQNAFNRAVSHTFGEDADKVTPTVMEAAKTRIGNELNNIADSTNTRVDGQFVQDIHSTLNDAASVLGKENVRPLISQVGRIYDVINPETGTITGDSYQALTRKGTPLDNLMSSADPNMRFYAGQLRDALDSAMQRSAPPELVNRLSTARSQYKAMKTVEDLVEKSPTGDISPPALMTPVRQSYTNMAYNGGGDLGDLARVGQRFLKEPPSSGTFERTNNWNMFQRAGGAGLGLIGLHDVAPGLMETAVNNPIATLSSIPASLVAGRVVGSTLRSNWLANNMLNRSLGRVAPAAPIGSRDLVPAFASGTSGVGFSNKLVNPSGSANP